MMHPIWLHNLTAYAWQVLFIVMVGALLAAAFRLHVPGARLAYWQALLAGCLLMPLLQPWTAGVADSSAAVAAGTRLMVIAGARSGSSLSLPDLILLLVGAVALLRLLWLTVGFLKLRSYRRRAIPLDPVPDAIAALQNRMGITARMCLSGDVAGPVTFGMRRAVILLPVGFLEMDPRQREAIVCHELLHVRRRDWPFSIAEELVRALLWFHPAIWWLLGQIQLAREEAVDREVVACTKARKHYLEALLAVAAAGARPDLAPAPLFLRKRHLKRRVAALLKEMTMSRRRLIASLAMIFGLLAVTGWSVIGQFPLRSAARQIPVGGRQQSAKLVKRIMPVYPSEAKLAHVQGVVRLKAVIARDGKIRDLKVLSGDPALAAAASKAVRQWIYEPTYINGGPVEVITQIDVNFTLKT